MTKRLKVGITQRVDSAITYEESRDCLDQRLIDWVASLDVIPVPIPNGLVGLEESEKPQQNIDNWLDQLGIDAVLLSGGNDIGEIKRRDDTERHILSWAIMSKKPVLGICRGMQMMGVFAGAELIQVDNHIRQRHQLELTGEDRDYFPLSVNSFHRLALKECPAGFKILARSEDGSIEAIKHEQYLWEGWMWHPEREAPYNPIDQMRFKKILSDAN